MFYKETTILINYNNHLLIKSAIADSQLSIKTGSTFFFKRGQFQIF